MMRLPYMKIYHKKSALAITICFYSIRRVLSFTDCCNSIPEGFKAMVPAILTPRLKNTGSIFVIAGLLMILVIASYIYSAKFYIKTTFETKLM